MNILLLTFAYLPSTGGVQRSVRNLAAAYAKRGHRVTIAADRIGAEAVSSVYNAASRPISRGSRFRQRSSRD
jgi:hypothetical protein